jgi:hypothetical protein
MTAATRMMEPAELFAGCARATVLGATEGSATVRLATGEVVDARAVMGLPVDLRAGDVVLCAAAVVEGGGIERFVVAIVAALRAAPTATQTVVVEHDAEARRSVVRLPRGSVRFEADGDLELAATQTVRVAGRRIEAAADEAEVTLGRGALRARRWEAFVEHATQTIEVLETRASRIVERAKNVYQEVEELAQVHAGRVRVVADDALHLHARRALVKADEDVKIRGEKIHLG